MGEPTNRHTWKVVASLALAVLLFAIFLRRAPLTEVAATLGRIKIGWALASTAAALISYAMRAPRWRVILRPVGRAPMRQLLGCTVAGFATSSILPARAGELVRPLLLSAQSGLPAAATLASILTERLLDGAMVLSCFAAGVLFAQSSLAPASLTLLRDSALMAAGGLAAVISLVLFLLRRREASVARLARLVPARFRPKWESFLGHLLDGLEVLRSPLRLIEVGVWSLGIWLVIAVQLMLMARAFGFPMNLGQAFVIIAASVVGLAVPTPAGVGGFHAAIQFGLTQFMGVDPATATAYALLHHAVCFFPVTVIGLSYLGSAGLSLGRVRALSSQEPPIAGQGGG